MTVRDNTPGNGADDFDSVSTTKCVLVIEIVYVVERAVYHSAVSVVWFVSAGVVDHVPDSTVEGAASKDIISAVVDTAIITIEHHTVSELAILRPVVDIYSRLAFSEVAVADLQALLQASASVISIDAAVQVFKPAALHHAQGAGAGGHPTVLPVTVSDVIDSFTPTNISV